MILYNSIINFKDKSTTCYQHVTNRKQQTIEIKCFVLHNKIKYLNKRLSFLNQTKRVDRTS